MNPRLLIALRWMGLVVLINATVAFLGYTRPVLLVPLSFLVIRIFWEKGRDAASLVLQPPVSRHYQIRNPDAGRWLEAPVAELDKSTVGKLLASRASRDPSLHVVKGSSRPPIDREDALYDPEIDG